MNKIINMALVVLCLAALSGCRDSRTTAHDRESYSTVISKIPSIFSYSYDNKMFHFLSYANMKTFAADPAFYNDRYHEIRIEAYRFGYSPDVIRVRKGDIVRLIASSRDVVHGIRIREYGIEVPVGPGEPTYIELRADKIGSFDIRCSVYCGSGHKTMAAQFIVEE